MFIGCALSGIDRDIRSGFWYNLLIVATEGGLIAAWSQIETIAKIPHIHTQNVYKALETASSDNLWW